MSKNVKILKHTDRPKQEGTYYRLVCLNGQEKGKAYYLLGTRAVMGRTDNVDIKVYDIKSSREHAEIVLVGQDYMITDLGSQNGIMVNDLKIKQDKLKIGDKIIIGQTVFKFDQVIVASKAEHKNSGKKDDLSQLNDDFSSPVEEKKSVKMILIGIIVISIVFLLMGEEKPINRDKSKTKYNVGDLDDPFTKGYREKKDINRETQIKMNQYFQNGLREFREENYFRAMSEFNHALTWLPNDALAQFYLRKTKEALDKSIESYFIKASRDELALKYQKAVVAYCAIVRLLYSYPEDERYIKAQEQIRKMEEILGLEENEIKCIEKIDSF